MDFFDGSNITEAVVERLKATPDPRLRQILSSLVRHLHAHAREVELTFDEWMAAIQFLTRTGQISVNGRQEFILLSDTLGLSMLVDALNNRFSPEATQTTVLGPFYLSDQPVLRQGADLSEGAEGVPLYVDVAFLSLAGKPIQGVTVDVWQSDSDGYYDVQRADLDGTRLRGRFVTDEAGRVRFWTIMPTAYPIPYDGPVGDMLKATNRSPWRPAHLHFMAAAKDYRSLVTHIFVAGDQYLHSDPVFGVKGSLIDGFPQQAAAAAPDGRVPGRPWRKLAFEFRLQDLG